jgi:tetratricopeptide (TPR) repeat protein
MNRIATKLFKKQVLAFGLSIASGLLISCGNQQADSHSASTSNALAVLESNTALQLPKFNAVSQTPIQPSPAATDVDRASEHLGNGNKLLAAGKLNEAIQEFQLAAKFNPDDENNYYNLALAYARAGNRELAKVNYQKALELFPDYAEAHNNLGNLLVAEGDFAGAIEHIQKAISLDGKSATAQNNLGNAYARQGKVASSLVYFQKALELKPDYADAHFNLANAYLILGRADEAVDEFNRLLQLHPEFSKAKTQLQKAKALQAKNRGESVGSR